MGLTNHIHYNSCNCCESIISILIYPNYFKDVWFVYIEYNLDILLNGPIQNFNLRLRPETERPDKNRGKKLFRSYITRYHLDYGLINKNICMNMTS